jgi:hypothetical protein
MASLACIPADIFREIVKYISAEEGIHKIKRGFVFKDCFLFYLGLLCQNCLAVTRMVVVHPHLFLSSKYEFGLAT